MSSIRILVAVALSTLLSGCLTSKVPQLTRSEGQPIAEGKWILCEMKRDGESCEPLEISYGRDNLGLAKYDGDTVKFSSKKVSNVDWGIQLNVKGDYFIFAVVRKVSDEKLVLELPDCPITEKIQLAMGYYALMVPKNTDQKSCKIIGPAGDGYFASLFASWLQNPAEWEPTFRFEIRRIKG